MRLRAVGIGCIGVFLVMVAFAANSSPVQAVGTGNCDPFDVTCLRTNNLYAADICAAGNTNCLTSYLALGLPVCAPGNTVCVSTYANAILTGAGGTSAPSGVISGANTANTANTTNTGASGAAPPPYMSGGFDTGNKPVFTISTPTFVSAPLVNGTVVSVAPTSVTGKYGIDVCASSDTNCLLTQQMQGVPICPPADDACRQQYMGVYKPIPTFGYGTGTPASDQNSTYGRRYVVDGSTAATGAAGVIVVSR